MYLLLPFLALGVIVQPRGVLFWKKQFSKLNILFQPMNREKRLMSGLFYPIFMFHRLVFIVGVFLFPPLLLVLSLIGSTIMLVLYLVLYRPFKAKLDRSLQLFNHVLLIMAYFFVLLIHFIED